MQLEELDGLESEVASVDDIAGNSIEVAVYSELLNPSRSAKQERGQGNGQTG